MIRFIDDRPPIMLKRPGKAPGVTPGMPTTPDRKYMPRLKMLNRMDSGYQVRSPSRNTTAMIEYAIISTSNQNDVTLKDEKLACDVVLIWLDGAAWLENEEDEAVTYARWPAAMSSAKTAANALPM